MRLFVFAIGGSGARVLTSMIMQFAAGVRPIGMEKEVLSVVPIIVDPHEKNAAVHKVIGLLNAYRTIRKSIYGNRNNANDRGFFSVKIETLKEISGVDSNIKDTFFFDMTDVSGNTFEKYIRLSDMERQDRMFMEMLFSKEELSTRMEEGFYGSPNIGTIALNEFKESPDFNAFRSAVHKEDRIFFIGSIFGGTGAAGLPLFISSIRDLAHKDNGKEGNTACSEVPIGALVVMPYFAIENREDSEINENHFLSKTRSALSYYKDNLNQYVNSMYYIADPARPKAFKNDPGKDGQKGNKAHIVEFVGATAISDFAAEPKDKLKTEVDDSGRRIAKNPIYKVYTLRDSDTNSLSFKQLPSSTNKLCMLPLMKFELLIDYMCNYLNSDLKEPYARKFKPNIESSILTPELEKFFDMFSEWRNEMADHGATAHNLYYFNGRTGKEDYTRSFNGIEPKGRMFGSKTLKVNDIKRSLNSEAPSADNMESQEARFFYIADKALEKALRDNLEVENL